MGFIFFKKLQAEGLQLYQGSYSQEVFPKIFPQIYCYLSILLNILGNFISQENLSMAAANRCKVFQVFISPKITYSGMDSSVRENLRHFASIGSIIKMESFEKKKHNVKRVLIRNYSAAHFSRIRTEYGEIPECRKMREKCGPE